MAVAAFDLDNTLLAGDSDYLWGRFLVEEGLVDGAKYEAANQRFYDDYVAGRLDIHEFLRFSLAPLTQHDGERLATLHADFMERFIEPIITKPGLEALARHRAAGDTIIIITATNSFVTTPISRRLGVEHLIATQAQQIDGRYTGEVEGIPSFQEGKVERLREWLNARDMTLEGSWFYSDSRNDLPLLELVDNPVAVDPDPALESTARARGWPIVSFRDGGRQD
ncbi:MAG: HAD family hydrolase [Gammaproteobacteria bacterium]